MDLYKDNYLVWEPIFVKITLVNNSEDTIKYIWKNNLKYKIKDSKGKEYEYTAINGFKGAIVFGAQPVYQKLSLKKTLILSEFQDILYFCGNYLKLKEDHKWCGPSVGIRKFLPPEQYTITVQRDIELWTPTEVKTINLESTCKFLVEAPNNEEELAKSLYEEAVVITWTRKKGDSKVHWKEEVISKYTEIAEKYPNSIYAPMSLSFIAILLRVVERDAFEGNKKALEIEKKIIDLYPDTPFAFEALKKIPMRYANMREMNEEIIKSDIRAIIEKYPDKEIGEEAKKLLQIFKEGKSSYHRIMKMKEK
jgi:hypothetical protein